MFKQIVVGADGHGASRDAIVLAEHLRAPDGELTPAPVDRRLPQLCASIGPTCSS